MRFIISQEACRDLESIWIYTDENWSAEQADRYYNLIVNEIEYLAENPESGIDYGHIREGYFRSRMKSHFIFYKNEPRKEEIEIIRILHQRMDIDAHLEG
ncbi:type II toxin-antitoxin system RelE/ParE family toxin [bacterium]|nr:type II toxin-antitoxin system RelE/ParE family toxin [bacterium]